jgi:hypothetical protein
MSRKLEPWRLFIPVGPSRRLLRAIVRDANLSVDQFIELL